VLKPVGGAGVEGVTLSVNDLLAVCPGEPLSETLAVKGNVPVALAIPLRMPLLSRLSPSILVTGVQL